MVRLTLLFDLLIALLLVALCAYCALCAIVAIPFVFVGAIILGAITSMSLLRNYIESVFNWHQPVARTAPSAPIPTDRKARITLQHPGSAELYDPSSSTNGKAERN